MTAPEIAIVGAGMAGLTCAGVLAAAGRSVRVFPSAQAVALLTDSPILAQRAADVVMDPCWAVMVRFEGEPLIPAAGLFVHGSPLAWAAHDGSKPGRVGASTWVLHANPLP